MVEREYVWNEFRRRPAASGAARGEVGGQGGLFVDAQIVEEAGESPAKCILSNQTMYSLDSNNETMYFLDSNTNMFSRIFSRIMNLVFIHDA